MTSVVLLVLGLLALFLLGVLVGTGLTTHAQDARDRRQAAIQRRLNDEARVLREVRLLRDEITDETPPNHWSA